MFEDGRDCCLFGVWGVGGGIPVGLEESRHDVGGPRFGPLLA